MDNFSTHLSAREVREFIAARELLRQSKIGVLDAARLAADLAERFGRNDFVAIKDFLYAALRAAAKNSPAFPSAFEKYLESRPRLRPRSRGDYKALCRKIAETAPEFSRKKLCDLTEEDCREALAAAFPNAGQARKARALLSAVFNFGIRRDWMERNPVQAVFFEKTAEREIIALSPKDAKSLVSTAEILFGNRAAAAVGLMLYAGIRPAEMRRLKFGDLDFDEKVVCIAPRHSKTGGARHVSIFPPLLPLLKNLGDTCEDTAIAPPNWERKWLKIRRACGFGKDRRPWQQDVLRHTFASYHLKMFRDIRQLQLEMGHSTPRLLFSRYLNLRGISVAAARSFWKA